MQTLHSLREWALTDTPAISYQMVIHANRWPRGKHVRRYNGSEASQTAAIIPKNEDGKTVTHDITLHRRGEVMVNGGEVQ